MSMIYGQLQAANVGIELTMFAVPGSTPLSTEPWPVKDVDLAIEEFAYGQAPDMNNAATRVGHVCLLATEIPGEYEVDVFTQAEWREHGIATEGMHAVIKHAAKIDPNFRGIRLYAHDADEDARKFASKFGSPQGYRGDTGSQLYVARVAQLTAKYPVTGEEGLVQV